MGGRIGFAVVAVILTVIGAFMLNELSRGTG